MRAQTPSELQRALSEVRFRSVPDPRPASSDTALPELLPEHNAGPHPAGPAGPRGEPPGTPRTPPGPLSPGRASKAAPSPARRAAKWRRRGRPCSPRPAPLPALPRARYLRERPGLRSCGAGGSAPACAHLAHAPRSPQCYAPLLPSLPRAARACGAAALVGAAAERPDRPGVEARNDNRVDSAPPRLAPALAPAPLRGLPQGPRPRTRLGRGSSGRSWARPPEAPH